MSRLATVRSGPRPEPFLETVKKTGPHAVQSRFFWKLYTVRSRISGPDRIAVQTGLDREIILRSGLKIWDRTAYKSVQSGPVPVPWSGPVSLPMSTLCPMKAIANSVLTCRYQGITYRKTVELLFVVSLINEKISNITFTSVLKLYLQLFCT